MQDAETVQCPFCGQIFELEIDPTVAEQDFVIDCEICCRPIEVRVECESGEMARVDVVGPG